MRRICPFCKKLVSEEHTRCPYCGNLLTFEVKQKRLTQKEVIFYVIGFLLLFIGIFYNRDLTNFNEIREGIIILVLMTGFAVFFGHLRKIRDRDSWWW